MPPTAEISLEAEPFVCGSDGEISIKVWNPNVNTDQFKYTDIQVGFETCEVANLEITKVEVGSVVLPDSAYGWIGDDLFVDFTKIKTDPDGMGGLSDLDGDDFYDDLVGGDSISLKVFLGVSCGNGLPDPASDVCPSNDCNFSQFYICLLYTSPSPRD